MRRDLRDLDRMERYKLLIATIMPRPMFAVGVSALGNSGSMTANVGKTTMFHGREPIAIWWAHYPELFPRSWSTKAVRY